MYSLPAYYIAKITSEFPTMVVFPLIYVSIVYWMVGLQQNAAKFFVGVPSPTFILLFAGGVSNSFGGGKGAGKTNAVLQTAYLVVLFMAAAGQSIGTLVAALASDPAQGLQVQSKGGGVGSHFDLVW